MFGSLLFYCIFGIWFIFIYRFVMRTIDKNGKHNDNVLIKLSGELKK